MTKQRAAKLTRLLFLVLAIFGCIQIWDSGTAQIEGRILEGVNPIFGVVHWFYFWVALSIVSWLRYTGHIGKEAGAYICLGWLFIAISRAVAFAFVLGVPGFPVALIWSWFGLSQMALFSILESHRWR